MYSSRLRLTVITVLIAFNYTVAEAKPNVFNRIAKKVVLPAATMATLLFAPVQPINALPSQNEMRLQPSDQVVQRQERVGTGVFFTQNGVGQRGFISESKINNVLVIVPTGPTGGNPQDQRDYREVVLPVDRIEALLDWDYSVIGNFVMFTPDDDATGLLRQKVLLPIGAGLADDGRMGYDGEVEREVAIGVISATTTEGDYVIKPYHHINFPPDQHDSETEHYGHRQADTSSMPVKHVRHNNTDLYLVERKDIHLGLAQVVLEETEINDPFFYLIAEYDRQRDANAVAQRDGLPLPHADVPVPTVSDYHTGKYQAEDFLGKFILYYEKGRMYVAYAMGLQEGKVGVFRPGSKEKKFIATEQIRASSLNDIEGMLGSGISFVAASSYPSITPCSGPVVVCLGHAAGYGGHVSYMDRSLVCLTTNCWWLK